jgi:hypothetical protein
MSQTHNFIITNDNETAYQLVSAGFKLVSQKNNVYTFLNHVPKNFNFAAVDKSNLAYTNILSI